MRQALARGGCRRVRGDRLSRVLRARRDRARGRPGAGPGPRGAQRAALRPTRRRRCRRSVELPDRDPLRDDRGRACHRQHGRAQARRASSRVRAADRAGAARGRSPARGNLATARRGRCRRRARSPPRRADDRVHGIAAGGPGDHPCRRRGVPRPALPEAGGGRARRQELRDRRRRRGPRRGGAGNRLLGVHLRGSEVLRGVPGCWCTRQSPTS